MQCSTVSAATAGALIASHIVGGGLGILMSPLLVISRDRPEVQQQLLMHWTMITLTAAAIGGGVGALSAKVASIASERFQ